ncbi:MAG: hypothetical protein ACM3TR_12040 [Caulobacteraceae bacterium]
MKLGIITMLSALHDASTVENSHYEFISGLKKEFDVHFIDPDESDSVDFPVVFIGSGGIENYFRNVYGSLPKPVVLLTDGMHNSLAASMEILAWIKELGDESIILHGSMKEIIAQIKSNYAMQNVRKRLRNTSIGVVGFPSDWLIASDVNYIEALKKWGVAFKNIEMSELSQLIADANGDSARTVAQDFIKNAAGMKEATEEDVMNSARVYLALKELCREYKLDALTLRCFELLNRHSMTSCLALSLLNNEGIVSGCEGDCQAAFSMLLLNLLTGSKAFIANPSYIDAERNEIVLAHCTVPTDITNKYMIRSHFESRIGVGIQGEVEEGPVTVFKCGGNRLDKYFVCSGQLIENLDDENMCRTQIRVCLDGNVSYFFRNPLANHHLIVKGDYSKLINEFMYSTDCKRIM